jgi:hypothetical protein
MSAAVCADYADYAAMRTHPDGVGTRRFAEEDNFTSTPPHPGRACRAFSDPVPKAGAFVCETA